MEPSQTSNLLQLSKTVLEAASAIVHYLQNTNQEEPSFNQNSSVIRGDDDLEATRVLLNEAANDLLHLVNGPINQFRWLLMSHYDLAAYQAALQFCFFRHVPLNGKIGLSELAHKAGIDQDRCGRVVRHLTTHHVFNEVEPDVFEHTSSSALLAKDSNMEALLLMQFDEMFKAATATSTSMKDAPFETNSNTCGFATYHGMSAYSWYTEHPDKALNFAKAMAALTKMDRPISTLRDEFAWDKLGRFGRIVDVGGGSGHVSIYLATHYSDLNFVVQESNSAAIAEGHAKLTPDIAERVKFMQHDFFTEQPITDASAFFLRHCLHNWNDEDCIRIIRALVPALERCKPGARVLINEEVLPERNEVSKYEENLLRQCDMCMMVIAGSKQRTAKEFEKLLIEADSRFEVVKIHGAYTMGLVEAYLRV
ncbi:O-methyltransferase [Fusarium heterosporum]|uniref:O-methyltransferase n=1 Tax=Fusarium heterosporum TaxID=42747 RepID=A0A8H5TCY2_FUSHE|nr:O-methyltransferase [Fusarium heterosporum]